MAGDVSERKWLLSAPILAPGAKGTFDEVAVKDPSIVFFEGMWHVFYTARSKTEYTTGYVSAKELADLQSAPRYELAMIRGKSRYGCAPQVFYFEPQCKWYLIFQSRDANYQPAFSTTTDISKPERWSKPKPLLRKDSRKKWIDFWIICDKKTAYLFYTEAHDRVIVRSTSLTRFPDDWSKGREILKNVHEAVHVYKTNRSNEFHMMYELNNGGTRSFGLASSHDLTGPWRKVTDRYATGDQLEYSGKTNAWTEMVSHGEVLRAGCNEQMEYDPKKCAWLIQGILTKDSKLPYESQPWKLGLMSIGEGSSER
jgi:Glycosyl hydrolase family 62